MIYIVAGTWGTPSAAVVENPSCEVLERLAAESAHPVFVLARPSGLARRRRNRSARGDPRQLPAPLLRRQLPGSGASADGSVGCGFQRNSAALQRSPLGLETLATAFDTRQGLALLMGSAGHFSASLTAALIDAGKATINVRFTARIVSADQGAFWITVRSAPTTISEKP